MKKKLLGLLASFALVFTLTGCGGNEEAKGGNVVNTSYSLHYETLNYLQTQLATDSDIFANMVEGLVESDYANRLVPVGCESYTQEVLENGKQVWTFNLRKDVKWFTNDGKEYGNVTAQDYVTPIQYILNPANGSETIGIVTMFIDGAAEYSAALADGGNADFSTVGVKAIDEYTLQYTTPYAMSYFPTALTYTCFLPANEAFLKEQGKSFGNDADSILINGPYFLTDDVKNSSMTLTKNPGYYNADIVEVETVNFQFIPDDAGADWARLKFENGELDSVKITEKDKSGYDKYVLGSDKTGTRENPASELVYAESVLDRFTFHYFFNYGRFYQEDADLSYTKTGHKDAASRENTALAIQNRNFRLGVFRGLDRTEFNQYYSPSNKDQMTRNIYTPRGLSADANGKDYVDYYVEYFAEQKGVSYDELLPQLSDSHDYYYQPEEAKKFFEAAKAELEGQVTFPVVLDYLPAPSAELYKYQSSFVEKFNSEFGEYATIYMVPVSGTEDYNALGPSGARNYDLNSGGWGPDYGDPLTYMDTYTTTVGYMYSWLSLPIMSQTGTDAQHEVAEKLFGDYTAKVNEANQYISDADKEKRLATFAEAEYILVERDALILPGFIRSGGTELYLSKLVPNTKSTALYGISDRKWKWTRVHGEGMTKEDREQYLADFNAGKYDELFYSANKSAVK